MPSRPVPDRSAPEPEEYAFGRLVSVEGEPDHIDGCKVQMVEKHGREVLGVYKCKKGCPFLQRGIERGQQLARERGWLTSDEERANG